MIFLRLIILLILEIIWMCISDAGPVALDLLNGNQDRPIFLR